MVDWCVILCNLGKTKTNFANYFPSERSEEEGEREETRPRVRHFLSLFNVYYHCNFCSVSSVTIAISILLI